MTSSKLRVAVVQFAPKLGEVEANIAKARELCRAVTPRSVDLLCLPEMIFSGYMFPDAASIAPYLEHPRTGPTSTFCAELARRLHCYVAAGYPERLEPESATDGVSDDPAASTPPNRPAGANSAILYGPTGDRVHSYRKTNLFETDLAWATPGLGFSTVSLPIPLGPVTVAICNDLNVQKPAVWETLEHGPYELAQHCILSGTRLLVLLNAWLRPESDSEARDGVNHGGTDGEPDSGLEPNWKVLNYWATRLRPTWARDGGTRALKCRRQRVNTGSQDMLVVLCNRLGHEGGANTFAGSSAMFSMAPGSGKARLLHAMGEREEGVKIWTAKLRSSKCK
ncbi:carbon-nitrogen hydrolase [Phlebopus sp. FC_14]|nr:carbon-nitrogen hydrolase [Phlebopus sp. FC_14]